MIATGEEAEMSGRFGAFLRSVALLLLLAARVSLAQEFNDGSDKPPTSHTEPNVSFTTNAKEHVVWAWHTWWGKLVLGLVVILTLVRLYYMYRARADRAARTGGGVLGG